MKTQKKALLEIVVCLIVMTAAFGALAYWENFIPKYKIVREEVMVVVECIVFMVLLTGLVGYLLLREREKGIEAEEVEALKKGKKCHDGENFIVAVELRPDGKAVEFSWIIKRATLAWADFNYRILGFRKEGEFSREALSEEGNGVRVVDSDDFAATQADEGVEPGRQYFYTFFLKATKRRGERQEKLIAPAKRFPVTVRKPEPDEAERKMKPEKSEEEIDRENTRQKARAIVAKIKGKWELLNAKKQLHEDVEVSAATPKEKKALRKIIDDEFDLAEVNE